MSCFACDENYAPYAAVSLRSAVLLVDLKNWRERNCGEKCFAYMCKPDYPILYEDQDVLNFTLHQDIALFPVKGVENVFLKNKRRKRGGNA